MQYPIGLRNGFAVRKEQCEGEKTECPAPNYVHIKHPLQSSKSLHYHRLLSRRGKRRFLFGSYLRLILGFPVGVRHTINGFPRTV